DCNYRSEPNCANCGCSHAATYAGCSSKKAATALRKQEILNGRAPNRRSPPSNPETGHQPETPSQRETSTPKKDRTYSHVLQRESKKQANTAKNISTVRVTGAYCICRRQSFKTLNFPCKDGDHL
ncbi:hypothetical protein HPB47_010455, partial [Ixodes persulcatus]